MHKKIVRTYDQLNRPTEPGEFFVDGLGKVELTQRDLDEWKESNYQLKMKLIESSGIADPIDHWQFIGWIS